MHIYKGLCLVKIWQPSCVYVSVIIHKKIIFTGLKWKDNMPDTMTRINVKNRFYFHFCKELLFSNSYSQLMITSKLKDVIIKQQ